jgi:hypothetical protein
MNLFELFEVMPTNISRDVMKVKVFPGGAGRRRLGSRDCNAETGVAYDPVLLSLNPD